MANNSATGGYLLPVTLTPSPAGQDLEDILTAHVVGITGLDVNLVRPRWQNPMPATPEVGVTWCAVGVMVTDNPDSPYLEQLADQVLATGHDVLEVMASFYGPNSEAMAARLRRGLVIPQNNAMLGAYSMTFFDCMPVRPSADLLNMQWVRRHDLTFRLRRQVVESYDVQSFTIAPVIKIG